ncbi:XkdQ/YqbQ family protein, partial [Corynebacterium amycolatum]
MVKNLKWVTDLNYSAGELTFDIVNGKDPIIPAMGAIVDFAWDNKDIFWGFVFSAECTSDTTVSVKAYDFERYLKSEGSVVFQSGTLGDRYSNVCRRFGVPFHIKEQPTYRVPAEVCDGKTGFDMIKSAIDKTYSATGEMYCIVANHM